MLAIKGGWQESTGILKISLGNHAKHTVFPHYKYQHWDYYTVTHYFVLPDLLSLTLGLKYIYKNLGVPLGITSTSSRKLQSLHGYGMIMVFVSGFELMKHVIINKTWMKDVDRISPSFTECPKQK